ncbi:unnamed protein product [Ectocarpus sp. 4 AP-2014]
MMRPAAGVASRGRAAAVRVAATAASRCAGGRREFVQNALPSNSSSSTSAVGFLSSKATSSTSYSQHGSGDAKDLTHWAVLAMGSALALWTAAATGSDDEAAAGVPAVACSAAMEKNSKHHHGDAGGQPSVDAPRRLTKRRSILLAEDEVDKQSGQSYYSSSLPSTAAGGEPPLPPADPTVSDNAPGVSLVVASTYNGNGPIEDRHDIRQSPRGDFFVSVLDGHGGWQAAELARKRLNIAAQTELKTSLAGNPDQVKSAITQAFLRVEREYLYQVKAAFELGFGAVARTGACAIMALVRDNRLFVANAGDCRAVLGRRKPTRLVGGWSTGPGGDPEALALSNDHNAKEQAEQAKLKKLHPFEGDVFTCKRPASCYVKGRLQPTRSFGDAYLKYPEFNGKEGTHRSAGRFLPPPYTPPYITAEPEISVHEIDQSNDDFVILASDGLWDHVTNLEAVEIVRKAAYSDKHPESASDCLVQRVLERAAENHGISVEELQEVPEGNRRRSMHDDITCVVFFLNGNRNNEGFASLQGSKVQGATAPGCQEAGTTATAQ